MDRKNLGWLAAIVILLAIIAAGTGSVWARQRPAGDIVVRPAAAAPDLGRVYLGGAVSVPGWYPVREGDTLTDLIAAAGGLLPGADLSRVSLTVGGPGDTPQRIDINSAEAWLLAALPGIGATKAQAIVDYREASGPFRDTAEITAVPGIGEGLYGNIRDLIMVGD